MMRKYRTYLIPAVFITWFFIFGFDVTALNVILAAICGVASYMIIGPTESTAAENPQEETQPAPEVDELLRLVERQLAAFRNTPLEIETKGISEDLHEMKRVISLHPEHAENPYLIRFIRLYSEYSDGLTDYLSPHRFAVQQEGIKRTQELYLQRFRKFHTASTSILNRLYRFHCWDVESENRMLEQVMAPLEEADFQLFRPGTAQVQR